VFQVRPATFRAEPHLDRRWTGSFQHVDVNGDPNDITPRLKGQSALTARDLLRTGDGLTS
jgi:hypothetical protein